MSVDLTQLLAERAGALEPPRLDPLDVVADGERRVQRRRRLVAAGASVALAVTIGATTLVLGNRADRTSPTQGGDARPLTYGQGQILHLGEREIDTGLDYLSLDVTDDGAALTTLDGKIWFTDGTEVEEVGATLGGRVTPQDLYGVGWPVSRPRDWVVNDSSGSLLAWLEYPDRDKTSPELVVYDSERRTVLARQTFEVGRGVLPVVAAVAGREVYVTASTVMYRYTLDGGTFESVDPAVFESVRREARRALVLGSAEHGEILGHAGAHPRLSRDHDRIPTGGSRISGLRDPRTGEPVDMELPDGFEGTEVWFLQWLDDDRFTVIQVPQGDLLVCQIEAGRCGVEIESSTWTSAPIIPGHGGVGAEWALSRAMRESAE